MLFFNSKSPDWRGYTLDEAADFLEYERSAVEYWLRMGHLAGRWDEASKSWHIRPGALVEFLREAGEPMPTGASARANEEVSTSRVPAA